MFPRNPHVKFLLFALFAASCLATDGAGQDSTPSELAKKRLWTLSNGSENAATFVDYDAGSREVTLRVHTDSATRSTGRGRTRPGRPGSTRTPETEKELRVPIDQLSKADRALVLKVFAPQNAQGQLADKVDPINTEYWKAVQRLVVLLDEIEETSWEIRYHQIAASIYNAANERNAARALESEMLRIDPSGTTLQVTADLNRRLLAEIGWDADQGVRKDKKQNFEIQWREFDKKARALPTKTRQRNPLWHQLQAQKNFAKQLDGNTPDMQDPSTAYRAIKVLYGQILEFEDRERESAWFKARFEELLNDYRKRSKIADRVKARTRHEQAKKTFELKLKELQNEKRELVAKHGGSARTLNDKANFAPFFKALENECLKNRQLAGQPIRMMAPEWTSHSLTREGIPIVALVIPGERNHTSFADIRRVPIKERGTPPVYARDLKEIPGAKYAYFGKGIDVWYQAVQIRMSNPTNAVKGFPVDDEQAQIKLLVNTLDLPKLARTLKLEPEEDGGAVVQREVNPADAANVMQKARAIVIKKQTWTNRKGKTAQMKFSKLDRKTRVATFMLKGGKEFPIKIDELNQDDHDLLLEAHGLLGH